MKQKTLGKLKQEVQTVVNRYIRLRDAGQVCISCRRTAKLEAGHFFPVKGYDGIRFDEDNIHGECAYCNRFNDAHLIGYAENLKDKIGSTRYYGLVERAEAYKRNGYKFTRSELEEIKQKYNEAIRTIQKR